MLAMAIGVFSSQQPLRQAIPFASTLASLARILFDLHRHELVHISGHTKVHANGQWRPLWSWGDGVDAQAPGPVPGSERIKKYRDKMSADDKDFDAARRRQKRRVVKRDPLTAMFFGS
jgi:hypothetical protein